MKRCLLAAVTVLALAGSVHAEDNIPVNDLTCVVKSATHIRNGPNGEFVAPVSKGDRFAPMEVEGGWLHVQVQRNIDGWISHKDLTCHWEPKNATELNCGHDVTLSGLIVQQSARTLAIKSDTLLCEDGDGGERT